MLAVAIAERLLGRRLRTVLDVGAGEGAWRVPLRRLRPRAKYTGIEPSADAVERFGRSRGIRSGTVERLPELPLRPSYDLVVCADLLHYLDTRALRLALAALATRTRGVLYAPIMTRRDDPEGDRRSFHARSARAWRDLFAGAGLRACGMHAYVTRARWREMDELMVP